MNASGEYCFDREPYGGPEDSLFVRGADYVSGWREADQAAREVNEALESLGIAHPLVRAVPHAGARGEPVIWLRPEAARVIACELLGRFGERRTRSDGKSESNGSGEG
ncbi:hypothetical protein EASAB2608_04349 [Streptomyces sp. EAS-AB2608]|nr:hypothetical protein EASAB2608_04349 [Streptomyces sp. EAS-AB2608]